MQGHDIITGAGAVVASPLTMSTLEVAGLTSKRHDNVLRDADKMLAALSLPALKFEGCYQGENGKALRVLSLPKRECMILVSGYSVELRARIVDRWLELETAIAQGSAAPVMVEAMSAEVRKAIGGIVKSVVHYEFAAAIPAMVEAEVARSQLMIRRGHTAGQVWNKHSLPRIKNGATWLGNRLSEMGAMMQGRAEAGARSIRLFDPDLADACMKNGLHFKAKVYASERMGQSRLRLVPGEAH